ncbi:type IV pilus assembly protein PilN [Bacillus sp. OV322]|nr:type IV pilus assembly protein PilN [Bacillus sp. OV322]
MMLAEINLLPKRETKSLAFLLIIIVFVVLLAIGTTVIYFQHQAKEQNLNSIQSQTQQTKQTIAAEQQRAITIQDANSASQMKSMVDWAETYPVKTVPVMKKLISKLPERGFFREFAYTEDGTILVTVQFDTSSDAAYYLNDLTKLKMLSEAKMNSLKVENPEDEKTTVSNETNSDGTAKDQTMENVPFLPRYLVVYEVKLDAEYAKKEVSEETESVSDEGGAAK